MIKNRYPLHFIILGFLMQAAVCYGYDDDLRLWTSAGFSWDVNQNWTFNYKEELRFYGMAEKLFQNRSDFGVLYKTLADWFDIGANFTVINNESRSDKHTEEYRPSLSVILRSKIFGRDISDRLRIEYRDRSDNEDIWCFRNKVTINRAFEGLDTRDLRLLKSGKIKPYVADEIFISSDGTGFNQNMLYFGLVFRMTEHTKTDVYYAYQSLKNRVNDKDDWNNNNVIGIEWTYHF